VAQFVLPAGDLSLWDAHTALAALELLTGLAGALELLAAIGRDHGACLNV